MKTRLLMVLAGGLLAAGPMTAQVPTWQAVDVKLAPLGNKAPALFQDLELFGEAGLETELIPSLNKVLVFWNLRPAAGGGAPVLHVEFKEVTDGVKTEVTHRQLDVVFRLAAGGATLFQTEPFKVFDKGVYADRLGIFKGPNLAKAVVAELESLMHTNMDKLDGKFQVVQVANGVVAVVAKDAAQKRMKVAVPLAWTRCEKFAASQFEVSVQGTGDRLKCTGDGRHLPEQGQDALLVVAHAYDPPRGPVVHEKLFLLKRCPLIGSNTLEY